jgi:hypothetical protein
MAFSIKSFPRITEVIPVDRQISEDMTLDEISSSSVYVWYSNIHVEKTVEILNYLKEEAESRNPVFYPIYTQEEMEADSSKKDTGLFFFRGESDAEYAIMNAGGRFMYVGGMHDSFPQALEVSRQGYNAFALIYRPDYAYSYLGRNDIPQASAVIMQYTGYSYVSDKDAPTYACVGSNDGIASWKTMQNRLECLESMGIPTEFHVYQGLSHGFGLGTGTVSEGWINDAVQFWQKQLSN